MSKIERTLNDPKIAAIYQVTLKIILSEGINAIRMGRVASGAGLATSTLYLYFKDKEDLVNKLYLDLKTEYYGKLSADLDPDEAFPKRFKKVWNRYFYTVLKHPTEITFLNEYYRHPFLSEAVVNSGDELLAPLLQLLDEGMRSGYLKVCDLNILLAFLSGTIHQMVAFHHKGLIELKYTELESAFEMAWTSVANQSHITANF